jgi:hypothetical protein
MPRASQVETSLSLQRPDAREVAAQYAAAIERAGAAQSADRKSTAVLVAVAVLTAICVIALGLIILAKSRASDESTGTRDDEGIERHRDRHACEERRA